MSWQSPFHDILVRREARFEVEHGRSIADCFGDTESEVQAARDDLAIFDLSDYNRLRISGDGAMAWAEHTLTLPGGLPGADRQRLLCDHHFNGTCLRFLQVQQLQKSLAVTVSDPLETCGFMENSDKGNPNFQDVSDSTAMLAVSGRRAPGFLQEKLPLDLEGFENGSACEANLFFMRFVLGMTHLEGVPVITIVLPAKIAAMAWDALEKYGQEYGIRLAGRQAWTKLLNAG